MTGDYIYNQITLRFPVSDFNAVKKKTVVRYFYGSTLMRRWDFLGKNREKQENLKTSWPRGVANLVFRRKVIEA